MMTDRPWLDPAYALSRAVSTLDDLSEAIPPAERVLLWLAVAQEVRRAGDAKADRELWIPLRHDAERPADIRFGSSTPAPKPGIAWEVGDKADCQHCHTPIEFNRFRVWQHKYTGEPACATSPMGDTMVDVEATEVHTYAAPKGDA